MLWAYCMPSPGHSGRPCWTMQNLSSPSLSSGSGEYIAIPDKSLNKKTLGPHVFRDLEICWRENYNPYRTRIPEVLFLLMTSALKRNLSINDRLPLFRPWQQRLASLPLCPQLAAGPKILLVWISWSKVLSTLSPPSSLLWATAQLKWAPFPCSNSNSPLRSPKRNDLPAALKIWYIGLSEERVQLFIG